MQMRLRAELSGCFQGQMRTPVVIAVKIVVCALLSELEVSGLERGVTELLTVQGAVEALNEGLVVLIGLLPHRGDLYT